MKTPESFENTYIVFFHKENIKIMSESKSDMPLFLWVLALK